jgi:hypothetical protein
MRKFIVFIIILCFGLTATAQNHRFAEIGAQWDVMYLSYWSGLHPKKVFATCDTLINNRYYQKIGDDYVMRVEGEKVFTRPIAIDTDILVYDFSLDIGDTLFRVRGFPGTLGPKDTLGFVVDSVASAYMGYNRKVMRVKCLYTRKGEWRYVRRDTWVEGIGSLYDDFIMPEATLNFSDMAIRLNCFYEHTEQHYTGPWPDSCSFEPNEIECPDNSLSATLYPNPTADVLNLKFSAPPLNNTYIAIYDCIGRIVMQRELRGIENSFSLAHLASGVYNYSIVNGRQKIQSGKVVVCQ